MAASKTLGSQSKRILLSPHHLHNDHIRFQEEIMTMNVWEQNVLSSVFGFNPIGQLLSQLTTMSGIVISALCEQPRVLSNGHNCWKVFFTSSVIRPDMKRFSCWRTMIELQASPTTTSRSSNHKDVEITFNAGGFKIPKFLEGAVWWITREADLIFLLNILTGHEVRRSIEGKFQGSHPWRMRMEIVEPWGMVDVQSQILGCPQQCSQPQCYFTRDHQPDFADAIVWANLSYPVD